MTLFLSDNRLFSTWNMTKMWSQGCSIYQRIMLETLQSNFVPARVLQCPKVDITIDITMSPNWYSRYITSPMGPGNSQSRTYWPLATQMAATGLYSLWSLTRLLQWMAFVATHDAIYLNWPWPDSYPTIVCSEIWPKCRAKAAPFTRWSRWKPHNFDLSLNKWNYNSQILSAMLRYIC